MVRYVCIAAGVIIAVLGLGYLGKLLILRFFGVRTKAEVIKVTEPEKGKYVHTLSFEHNGKTVVKDDRSGYSQPFLVGEEMTVICSKSDPGKFGYERELNKNILITLVLIVMAVLVVVRFAFFVTEV